MKLTAILKPGPRCHRALLMGMTAILAGLGLPGCSEFEYAGAREDREAKEALEEKEKHLEYVRTHCNPVTIHPVYALACTSATPGNPGHTDYSLTGPNGAQASITVPGFADHMVVGDL